MARFLAYAFVAALCLSISARAQAPQPGPPTSLPPPGPLATPAAVSPPARIDAMAWLKGYWVGDGFGGKVEDLWGPPRAGVMLGAFRMTRADGKPGFYEMAAIEEVDNSLRLVVKHFHSNWIGWEEKDHAHQAKLVKLTPTEVVFGNITFKRKGKNDLDIEMHIVPKDGTPKIEVLHYKRQAL